MDNTIAPLDPMISDHRRLDLKFRPTSCTNKKLDKSDCMRIDFFTDPDLTKEFVTGMMRRSPFQTVEPFRPIGNGRS